MIACTQRTRIVALSCFTMVVLAVPCTTGADGVQKSARFRTRSGAEIGYLLYLPEKYEQEQTWPLMLFLHGAGERGNDLEKVKRHGPPKLVEAGQKLPFIVVSPQCRANARWQPDSLSELLDDISKNYKVDRNRVYVTGLSMGGFGTWSLAVREPDRFAAIVPICGGGDPTQADRIAALPIWVFHGAKDQVVPLQQSERMVEALKKVDGKVRFTVYPEASHDSWTETYANPELYQWLLQQKRSGQSE